MLSRAFDPENDCPFPECPNNGRFTSHYHCAQCRSPEPTGYMGHYVGGNRHDAQVICDPIQRAAYVRSLRATPRNDH